MDRYVDFMEEIMSIFRSEMRNKAAKKMLEFSFTSDILSEWAQKDALLKDTKSTLQPG